MSFHKKYILKYRTFYQSIEYLKCPTLNNEIIYFNNHGFRHLLIKGRKWRKPKDQLRRLELLKYVKSVICSTKPVLNYRAIESKKGIVQFWSLEITIKINTTIIVVIRQIGSGRKHFFSIFSRND